ncbi:MAG: T9SS type A sorting domain-containing protein [bacterium]|nr:T9SS type A sorting domain-containing protein [bacterium]
MRALFLTLLALCLAECAWAQPLEGPWVAREFTSDFTVSNPHLCVRADSLVDLFCGVRTGTSGQVNHSVFDLSRHELAVAHNDLALPADWTHHIEDALTSGSDWCVMVTGMASPSGGTTRGTLFRGRNQPIQQHILFEDFWYGRPWYGGAMLEDCRLSERLGGGVIVSGLIEGAWGWEIDTWVWTVSVSEGSVTPLWEYSFWPNVFIPNTDNAHAVSIAGDSALSVFHHYGGHTAAISALPGPMDSLPRQEIFSCPMRVLKLARTDGGRLLCLSGGTPMQCLELSRGGFCQVVSEFSAELSFHAAAWHPHYGFAVTFGSPSFLLLARMDTNGVAVHPLGILHERDPGHAITESDVTITDDGRVIAAWLEQTESQSALSRLMIASVGWDTYLEADDSRFIPRPSAFSLSAYPNPFNSTLKIEYTLPRAGDVEVSVYNVLGQMVETLLDARVENGTHAITWNPTCAGGLYFVTLKTESATRTAKVLYLR